ncbi:Cleavage stimulation factor subunit 1 [Smittium mucronatum]|uniref:Cleavage stimulation factor 50 kDa subunit n=1 Tax=Smittium mucronatum TaxID=133383 RepID=A0A1R0GSN8_9FUNG|nr:Cleavage stimulation factor subunit 1 [Smittium mucronatum]
MDAHDSGESGEGSEPVASKSTVLPLILSQLSSYGYANLSSVIAKHTNTRMTAASNNDLARLVFLGEKYKGGFSENKETIPTKQEVPSDSITTNQLDKVPEQKNFQPPTLVDYSKLKYEISYQTSHKGPATCAAFSLNGQFFATGSADSTLKLVSIERLNNSSQRGNYDEKPVIRTLYDHRDVVNQVTFHPNGLVLASCSDDQSIKLFDLSLAQGKRSFRFIQDNSPIRTISFHPSGDYLASGTASGKLVLYDIKTLSGSTPNITNTGMVNSVRFSNDGRILSMATDTGESKIIDGITGQLLSSFATASRSISSTTFNRSGKSLLSSSLPSNGYGYSTQLWDTSSGKMVQQYMLPSKPNAEPVGKSISAFNFDENLVFASDPASGSVCCWDTRTAKLMNQYGGFSDPINYLSLSPTDSSFVTCSQNNQIHYWRSIAS